MIVFFIHGEMKRRFNYSSSQNQSLVALRTPGSVQSVGRRHSQYGTPQLDQSRLGFFDSSPHGQYIQSRNSDSVQTTQAGNE